MSEATRADMEAPLRDAYALGEHVYMRYPTEEDARGEWHKWFNAPDTMRYLTARRWPVSEEEQVDYLRESRSSSSRLLLAVCDRSTLEHVGVGSLGSIDWVNRNAEMSLVIGSRKHRSGPYALEALSLLLEIGLARLNLHKIYATGLEGNEGGLALNGLLGMTESGRYREHAFLEGRPMDMLVYEILQREWLESPRRPELI